jgi:hypothetical protein
LIVKMRERKREREKERKRERKRERKKERERKRNLRRTDIFFEPISRRFSPLTALSASSSRKNVCKFEMEKENKIEKGVSE